MCRIIITVAPSVWFPFRKVAFIPRTASGPRGADSQWGCCALTAVPIRAWVAPYVHSPLVPDPRSVVLRNTHVCRLPNCFSCRVAELVGFHRRGRGRGRRGAGRRRPEPVHLVREVLPRHRTVSVFFSLLFFLPSPIFSFPPPIASRATIKIQYIYLVRGHQSLATPGGCARAPA